MENLNISSYMKYEPDVRRNGLVQMKVLPSTLYRQKFICTVKTYYLLLIITFFLIVALPIWDFREIIN